MKINRIFKYILFIVVPLSLASCQKYLDAKPDKALTVPSKAEDLQALLNFYASNQGYDPVLGEIAADNFFLLDNNLNTQTVEIRSVYLWDGAFSTEKDWQASYTRIFKTNVVLDNIDKVSATTETERNFVKGQAFFMRGWSLFKVMAVYAPAYNPSTANTDLGIPIKLTGDINSPTTRPSLKANMDQVISDYTNAIKLLPNSSDLVIRPSKAAAYAALAEAQLVAQNYTEALMAATESLKIKSDLTDYNTLSETSAKPLTFPAEVLLDSRVSSQQIVLNKSIAKVNPTLYGLYTANDKRRTIFYGKNADNSYFFKGSYDGNLAGASPFSGLAVDEVYLVAAEAAARLGKTADALEYLNTLSKNRYDNTFVPFTATSPEAALSIIIEERRKELAFRGGIRWMDLKRLNLDPRFATILTRTAGGITYTLAANDPRYVFLIPESVIQLTGIPQNRR